MIRRGSMIALLTTLTIGQGVRADVGDLGADWIAGKSSESEFWTKAREQHGDLPWSPAERAYLDDLYSNRKAAGVPLHCDRWDDLACGGIAGSRTWDSAPPPFAAPIETPPSWKNPWIWSGIALVLGGAIALRGKRVVFEGPSLP